MKLEVHYFRTLKVVKEVTTRYLKKVPVHAFRVFSIPKKTQTTVFRRGRKLLCRILVASTLIFNKPFLLELFNLFLGYTLYSL